MVEVAPPSRSEGGASKRSDASGGCSGMCGVQVVLDEDDPIPSACIPCEIRFALSRPLRFAKGRISPPPPFVPPFALRRGCEQAQRCERGMLGVVRGVGCFGRGRSHPLRVHPLRNSLRSFASPSQSEGEDFSAASARHTRGRGYPGTQKQPFTLRPLAAPIRLRGSGVVCFALDSRVPACAGMTGVSRE